MSTITCTHRVRYRRGPCADRFTTPQRHDPADWDAHWTLCLCCGGGAAIQALDQPAEIEFGPRIYAAHLGVHPKLGVGSA